MLDTMKIFQSTGRASSKHKNYFPVYDRLFSPYVGRDLTLVEIGVQSGGSLLMWREFFGPKARIIGVDLNPTALALETDGFEVFIGDQASEAFWAEFFLKVGDVDIVIDDGGHTYEQQIVTTTECLPRIRDGGMILVEDTHTSFMHGFGHPSPFSYIQWAKRLVDVVNARFPEADAPTGTESQIVHSIEFFESMVCLKIDRELCVENAPLISNGVSLDANDFRYAAIKEKYPKLFEPEAPVGHQPKDSGLLPSIKRAIGKRVIRMERAAANRGLSRFFK